MPDTSEEPIAERVRKLEERVEQLMEILQIVPRMDTKHTDYSSAPDHAKSIFLTKLSEIKEDPSVAPQQPFSH